MSTLHNQQVSFDSGKLPGGKKGIRWVGLKITINIQQWINQLKAWKKKRKHQKL